MPIKGEGGWAYALITTDSVLCFFQRAEGTDAVIMLWNTFHCYIKANVCHLAREKCLKRLFLAFKSYCVKRYWFCVEYEPVKTSLNNKWQV